MHIQTNHNLTNLNTFKINAQAKYFVEIGSESDFLELIPTDIFKNNKKYVLGCGSNTLFTQDFDGLVIHNTLHGKTIIDQDNENVIVEVAAGENRDSIVHRALDQGRSGMENLVAIPGSVGAAAVQNIGAYGIEAQDLIQEVKYMTYAGKVLTKKNADCLFGYRQSFFKSCDHCFIISVTFKFTAHLTDYQPNMSYQSVKQHLTGRETPIQVAQIIADVRASKLPDRKKIGTAGSFFKNPIVPMNIFLDLQKKHPDIQGYPLSDQPDSLVKLFAGSLIDSVVGKGYRQGTVGIYDHHALVLVNHGGATGEQMHALVQYIQTAVHEQFGLMLEPEVVFV